MTRFWLRFFRHKDGKSTNYALAETRAQPPHKLDTNMNARHSVPRHPCIDDLVVSHEPLAPTVVR